MAIIKHTDDGETKIETPEKGASFEIYLKSAGSYDAANKDERDTIVCDEYGFGQTKDVPYGIYTVHQTSGWEGREMMDDFDVFISQNAQTYRYLINNRKDYNSFCLDEEDINPLQNFVAQIKSADSDSVIYVSTYGYEITNSKGEKSTYADALWIDTVLPISQIERYIEKSGVAEPTLYYESNTGNPFYLLSCS